MIVSICKHTRLLLFSFALLIAGQVTAQEICDNGIDDDNDGLIDLNDSDCFCTSFIESSLIPNPSFEERSCCPTSNEQLNCADEWIQASAPTTDYVHTCGGYLGNTSIPAVAPLPFSDGEGAVGFRDGQQFAGSNYKEYVGACLTERMEVGLTYRLDFFVGFQDGVTGSTECDLAFFGATQCNRLPFGGGNNNIGCPLNTGNYVQLAEVNVSGSNQWVNTVVEFTADQPYEVLVLGPACEANPNYTRDPYFYVDRLALAEVGEFGIPLESIDGNICEDTLNLTVTFDEEATYQWYKDGVAIVGSTDRTLRIPSGPDSEGTYEAAIYDENGCGLSQSFVVSLEPIVTEVDMAICEGEIFGIGGDELEESGSYSYVLQALNGCDSTVFLDLDVNVESYGDINDAICEGDVYTLYDLETTEAGVYETMTTNAAGCDSFITVELEVITPSTGLELVESITIELGDSVDIDPDFIDPNLVSFSWSEGGTLLSESSRLADYRAVNNIELTFSALDIYGCGVTQVVRILVDKSNLDVQVPNIFSPQGDFINDRLAYWATKGLDRVSNFTIYDRWGGIVYKSIDTRFNSQEEGWDGTSNGQPCATGVYVYILEAVFLDGSTKVYHGDITIVR